MNVTKSIASIKKEDDDYYRVEFYLNDWKFHSAKMPERQASKLFADLTA